MRFKVEPRDVPLEQAARRMGMSAEAFTAALPSLVDVRGFPAADPDTGNFDLVAIDRWCDLRHHHLLSPQTGMGPRAAGDVVPDRLAALRTRGKRPAVRRTGALPATGRTEGEETGKDRAPLQG
jgi:hypothetical protein